MKRTRSTKERLDADAPMGWNRPDQRLYRAYRAFAAFLDSGLLTKKKEELDEAIAEAEAALRDMKAMREHLDPLERKR